MTSRLVFMCPRCCGQNVATTVWVDPNTGEETGDDPPLTDDWCNDCEAHVRLVWHTVNGSGVFARVIRD